MREPKRNLIDLYDLRSPENSKKKSVLTFLTVKGGVYGSLLFTLQAVKTKPKMRVVKSSNLIRTLLPCLGYIFGQKDHKTTHQQIALQRY